LLLLPFLCLLLIPILDLKDVWVLFPILLTVILGAGGVAGAAPVHDPHPAPGRPGAGVRRRVLAGVLLEFVGARLGKALLCTLFAWIVGVLLTIAGEACCCVGVYPAAALAYAMAWHLYGQLYTLYLERGGTPIAIHPDLLARP